MAICAACGQENPDRARFCFACGAALGAHDEPPSEERRLVTVVFSELVGVGGEGRAPSDPEELKRSLDPYHALVRQEVTRYGGTVDKFMGASALWVFGAPVAHEDDPERAVRAALALREAVEELAEDESYRRVGVRFGIDTGEAVVARPGTGPQIGEAVTGDVVNTASRLLGLGGPGEIVIGEETHAAAEFAFGFAELDQVTVKGKRDPLRVWRVLSSRGRFGIDLRPRPSTPFVGRREERELLERVFRRSVSERSVQLVTITGEPGSGKTRLVEELQRFVDELPDLVRWRQGRSLPYGDGVAYWALGEIVKAEARILESDPPELAERKLAAAVEHNVPESSERDWLRARLAPLAGLEDATVEVPREELFTAWRRYLEALSTRMPAVFVFEDLQWADDGMLAFIEHLVDWAVGLPMLVVCTARPELYERHPAWGGGRRNATSIALSPLSEQETSMLLSALLERDTLPARMWARVLDAASGNPLYAEEFARMLRAGPPVADDGEPPMPRTLQLLIGARLDTLGQEEKATIQDASIVGKVFWTGALASMSGLAEEEIERRLHEAVQREFIRPVHMSSVAGQREWAFLHALVREVAHGQIPRAARAAKHVAAASWIREVAGERVVDVAEVLAHHYMEALRSSRSTPTGLEVQQLEADAGSALMMAGDRAKRLDPSRALSFFLRARDVLHEGEPERTRALVEAAEAEEDTGRFEEATGHFELAVQEYRAAGDRLGIGETLARRARSVRLHGVAAHELLEEAIALLEAEEPGPELARAYARMAGHLYVAGDNRLAVEWAERSIVLADELGMEGETVLALQYRGAARAQLGDRGGLDDLQEALRRGLELGLGHETASAYNNLAYELWFWEGPAAAQTLWDEMEAFCRVRGFHTMEMWARGGALESLFDLGEWDRVLRTSAEMLLWDRQHGPTRVSVTALTYRGWVHLRRGGVEEAAATCEEVLPLARGVGYAEYLAPPLVLAAEVALARGDPEASRQHIRGFLDATEGSQEYRTMFLPVVVRVLVSLGEVREALRLVGEAEETATSRHRLGMLSSRAIVAEATGDLERAAELYAWAAVGWGEYRFGLECARVSLGAGRCLLRLGREQEAVQLLTEARRLLQPLGARPLLDEVQTLLGTTSLQPA